MNIKKICAISLIALGITGCTTQIKSTVETNSPSPVTQTPTASPTSSPTPEPTATSKPTNNPTKSSTAKPTPSATIKSEVKSYSTTNSNSTTNIDIKSNGVSVKVVSENGKRYAERDGTRYELDAKGCYTYKEKGSDINVCIGN